MSFFFFWSLHSLFSFFQWWFLLTPLVSFGLCILSSSSNGGFWLHLWYLLVSAFSLLLLLLLIAVSGYTFGICWSLHSLFFFFHWWFLVTPLVSFGLCILSSSSNGGFRLHFWYLLVFAFSLLLLPMVVSGYTFGIFWSLHSLFFFFQWWFLVTPLVSFDLCILSSSSSSNGGFWLHLWYLLVFAFSLLLLPMVVYGYTFGIFKPFLYLIRKKMYLA